MKIIGTIPCMRNDLHYIIRYCYNNLLPNLKNKLKIHQLSILKLLRYVIMGERFLKKPFRDPQLNYARRGAVAQQLIIFYIKMVLLKFI